MNLVLRHIGIFLAYLVAQLLVFNNFNILDVAAAHVFLVSLLIIPVSARFPLLITLGFIAGMMVDVFSIGAFKGLHAFSCVLMLALRNGWVSLITSKVAYRGNEDVLIQIQPIVWLVQYLLPLIFVYETAYQLLEAFSFDDIMHTIGKIFASTFYTFTICIIFIAWIHRGNKK
jgi:hypothetical protein